MEWLVVSVFFSSRKRCGWSLQVGCLLGSWLVATGCIYSFCGWNGQSTFLFLAVK